MVDSDDEAGDGDGFGANAAVRLAQPQVTIADNVSSPDSAGLFSDCATCLEALRRRAFGVSLIK